MLSLNNRRCRESEEGLTFKTPEAWLAEGVRRNYEDVVFDRNLTGREAAQRVLGVGHKAVDEAILQARESEDVVAVIAAKDFTKPLFVFRIHDRVTGGGTVVRSVLVGLQMEDEADKAFSLLRDWEVLLRVNKFVRAKPVEETPSSTDVSQCLVAAEQVLLERLARLQLPFKIPQAEPFAVLWPYRAGASM